jgi:hypothetical protein
MFLILESNENMTRIAAIILSQLGKILLVTMKAYFKANSVC